MDTVTQMASQDVTLCGVRQWAAIVWRIREYPGATDDTPVSTVWRNDRMEEIKSIGMVTALRAAVMTIVEDKLGFLAHEVGTHTIRSGTVMAMYLGECSVYTIMMILVGGQVMHFYFISGNKWNNLVTMW